MNVSSPEFILDPYRFYEQKRRQSPIIEVTENVWTITGYHEMSKVLANPAAGRGNVGQRPRPDGNTEELNKIKAQNPALDILDRWMLFKNPPEHAPARKSIADKFTINMVSNLEPKMRGMLELIVAEIKQKNVDRRFDLVQKLAYQFPIQMICRMLGLPDSGWQHFQNLTSQFSRIVQSDFHALPEKTRGELNGAAIQLKRYFDAILPIKRDAPQDDLISQLINAGMPSEDIVANAVFLLFAGQETSTLAIGNAFYALLSHPEELEALRSNSSLAANAVEESLRFDAPIQMVGRLALDNIKIDDHTIQRGAHIQLFLGAAGRDPSANSNPHRFDISRTSIKHLAFARGAHHCLGASLARRELELIFTEFLPEFHNLRLSGQAVRQNTWLMRGFHSLPVAY